MESNGSDVHGAASDSENNAGDSDGEDDASALEADDEDFERLEETARKEHEEQLNPPTLKRRKSSTVSPRPDWPPRWWKFVLILDDKTQIAFADCRRLGRVFLHKGPDPMTHTSLKKLGFDALLSVPSQEDFDALVARRSLPLKALLLNQSFAAGVGNWIADEVLYQARIHPEKRASNLDKAELKILREKIIYIVKTAVDLKTQSKKLPDEWLFHRRWSKAAAKKETQKTVEGYAIAFATVGGRTSAYVPELQPAPEGFVSEESKEHSKSKGKPKKSPIGKKKGKKKKEDDSMDISEAGQEDEASMSDESDSGSDADLPVVKREKSSRLSSSRKASLPIMAEESSEEEGPQKYSRTAKDDDDDFQAPKRSDGKNAPQKKAETKKKRQPKTESAEDDLAPSPKRAKTLPIDVGDSTVTGEVSPPPAKPKRPKSKAGATALRKKSSGVKKEPGAGH